MSEASERRLQAKAAAHTSWANTSDRTQRTANARAAADDRFARQVDPDGVLPEDERARRAESARTAFYIELSRKSAAARRRRRT